MSRSSPQLWSRMGPSAVMTESTDLYSLSMPAILGRGGGGCPSVQLKELRLKKGSGMPMRGVEFNWEPGPRGWAWVNGG